MKANGVWITVIGLLLGAPVNAGEPDAVEIMRKAYRTAKPEGVEEVAQLIIISADGSERVRKMAMVSKMAEGGSMEKRLIRFVAPADMKGTGFLTYDREKEGDDMWLYLPSFRKTRRIVASEKSKSFMGSEFSYGDITPARVEDFNHQVKTVETVGGEPCWVIASVPRSKDIGEENGFSLKVSYIAKRDHALRRAVYYDLSGKEHKELIVHEVREVDPKQGRVLPSHMEMINKQDKRRSIIKVDDMRLRQDVPEEYFSLSYLERQ